jgi:hypothetical protein
MIFQAITPNLEKIIIVSAKSFLGLIFSVKNRFDRTKDQNPEQQILPTTKNIFLRKMNNICACFICKTLIISV